MTEQIPEAVPETDRALPAPDDETVTKTRPSVLPLVIALLALILAIALAVAAYFTWHQVQRLGSEQAGIETGVSERIQPLRTSLDSVNRTLQEDRRQLESQMSELDEGQQRVGHRLNVLAALMGRSERGWTLAEVEYLLRIANQRLQLQRDLHTASQALRIADERLRDLADPNYLSVREQIALDIDAVNAVPAVDTDGMFLQLGAVLQGIDTLPVKGTVYEPPAESPVEPLKPDATADSLREFAALVWSSLSELFRLRDHEQPVAPMLPPDREYFLRENLRLQLAAAQLALLRDDGVQFRAVLETALSWLNGYFDVESPVVQQLTVELTELESVDISPPLPDVSASLRLLRQQIKLSEQPAVLPVVPGEQPQTPDSPEPTEPVATPEVESAS